MTALEELKKAFPNMFRPLKWHHFDGATEHGCGEWYAHATRGMYHIYDVREKFPNDRPFYAKELSDQFDTLEQAQDAVQNRHELDIVMCLDPDFRSTIESLQRENERLQAEIDRKSSIPGDHRYWEGRYRDEAAENERLREALEEIRDEDSYEKLESFDGSGKHITRTVYGEFGEIANTALASTGGEHNAE
ncbi:hypothetical protein [Agrobacterium sp. MCAB5]|uniref:hypothetical protein n=1 Tax=Agrobacterium sp. MCAB5 TaxID=3233042 RepID=UPI003F913DF7